MKSLRLTLVLCILAVNLIACSSDQEKIDRAVQMTLAAQQPVSAQPTEKATNAPTPTQTATKVVPKNTATPIPTSTIAPTETPAAKTFAEALVGIWSWEGDGENEAGWIVFGSDGLVVTPFKPEGEKYVASEDGSIRTYGDDGNSTGRFDPMILIDDNTLGIPGEFELHRQAPIDPAKLIGTWIADNSILEFLTPNQGVFYGTPSNYEIRNNILYLTDTDSSSSSFLSFTSDGELSFIEYSEYAQGTRVFRKHTLVMADGSRTPRGDEVLFPFHVSGKESLCGYIDRFGAVAIEPIYGYCGEFSEGLAAVTFISFTENWGINFGYINNAGEFVIPQNPEFQSAGDFHEGLAAVETNDDDLMGYIDRTGTLVIPAQFKIADNFSGGVAHIETDSGHGLIDTTGHITPIATFSGRHSDGLARVNDANGCHFIDVDGQIKIQTQGYMCGDFSEGLASINIKNGNCYYIDTDGQIAIQTEYSTCYSFSDGLAAVFNTDDYIGFSCGYIDTQGKLVIDFQNHHCSEFSSGRAAVEVMLGYGGESGYAGYQAYIDKKGEYVFNPTMLDWARDFKNGLALIGIGGQTTYIDTNGKIVYQSQDWPETPTTGPDPVSALSPYHYYSVTSTGTDFSNTDFFRHIVGMRVIWAGTVLSVASDGSVPVNVPSDLGTVQMVLHDIDQATLLRLRNNDQITFVATLADFDTGGSRRVPQISAKKATVLTINE